MYCYCYLLPTVAQHGLPPNGRAGDLDEGTKGARGEGFPQGHVRIDTLLSESVPTIYNCLSYGMSAGCVGAQAVSCNVDSEDASTACCGKKGGILLIKPGNGGCHRQDFFAESRLAV